MERVVLDVARRVDAAGDVHASLADGESPAVGAGARGQYEERRERQRGEKRAFLEHGSASLYPEGQGSARRSWLAALIVLAAVLASPPAVRAAGPSVETEWRVLSQPVGPEGRTELALAVTIAPGWHVNAHDPDRPYLIPTNLQLEPPAGAKVAEVRYPDAVVRSLAFAGGTPLRLYEGRFTIAVRLEGAATGTLTGGLRYQACNDETCLPPRTLPVSFAIGGRGEAAGVLAPAAPPGGTSFERWVRDRGLLATLAIAALLGLGLNLTPCVYPLISVTIAYFGGQSGQATGRIVLLACAYVLGIAITFSALGVSAALSGSLFGSALQQPLVLAGVAVVLVLLAASNFGLWHMRAPGILAQRAGKASAGMSGALAMGLTMGVVAAPCVGPIVVALLLFIAARQDAVLGFALFFALAVGMGAPYVALAVAAGSIRRLPRSGEWLAWVEHLFGFLLLGLALYFLEPLLGADVVEVALPRSGCGCGRLSRLRRPRRACARQLRDGTAGAGRRRGRDRRLACGCTARRERGFLATVFARGACGGAGGRQAGGRRLHGSLVLAVP